MPPEQRFYLREWMAHRQLSIAQLHIRSGVSHQTIKRLRKNKHLPHFQTLTRLAQALGASSTDQLLRLPPQKKGGKEIP